MYKMFWLGDKIDRCHRLEQSIMKGDYTLTSKKRWFRDIEAWKKARANAMVAR